jgi:hypothetical protein
MNYNYKYLYNDYLPIFAISATTIGFYTGLFTCGDCKSNEIFINIIGYTSIGVLTGITYPISCPLIGLYILHKKQIK